MKNKVLVLALVSALLVSVIAPALGGRARAATATTVAPAVAMQRVAVGRTAFVIHAGIAFFLFHHVYALYKKGDYSPGAHLRTIHLIAAAGYIVLGFHEVQKAIDAANSSNSKVLHALVAPLNAVESGMSALASGLKGGNVSSTQFTSINNSVATIEQRSSQGGYPITESQTGS